MRGENDLLCSSGGGKQGSSPHARGKRPVYISRKDPEGLIPACAGKTLEEPDFQALRKAHPRMRGENFSPTNVGFFFPGSSPHARGKRGLPRRVLLVVGLIPACAGKTLADLDQHRAIEPIRYNLSRIITDIKPRQRREKLEPLSSKGSPPPLRGCPLI